MNSFEEKLRNKISVDDLKLLNELINTPISRIRAHIQSLVDEVESK